MARKKSTQPGNLLLPALIGVVALIAAIPKEVWIFVGIVVAFGVGCFLYAKFSRDTETEPTETKATSRDRVEPQLAARTVEPSVRHSTSRSPDRSEPVRVTISVSTSTDFRIPQGPKEIGTAVWVPPGDAFKIGNASIPGGMVYVGKLSRSVSESDPCLIDLSKPIGANGDLTAGGLGYWPSYSEIAPSARRAYLNWLADGRRNTEADIGYVFLFFYGLERRVLLDAPGNAVIAAELPFIARELERLLSIYADKSSSFRRYASELLDWISLGSAAAKLYERPIPALVKSFELPLYMRLALGQTAVDNVPVPPELAVAWALLDPNISLRTPAKRCPDQFKALFKQRYEEAGGFRLPRNRTRLKCVYRPASAAFRGSGEISRAFGDIPDVTALTGPAKKLQDHVDIICKALDPYSRYLGKNADTATSLEGLLQLPATLWPANALGVLEALKSRMGGGMIVISFQELLSSLDAKSALTREKMLGFGRALESMNIGMEPDILGGAKPPKADEKIVLFSMNPSDPISRATPSYQVAVLTLQLSAAVATADGQFTANEMNHLRTHILSWTHLSPVHHRRLLAHMRLLMLAPVSLTSLKKKLEPLDATARETLAAFMATVAQSDGTVSPDEVKMLEKVYKVLGVDPDKVFNAVHAVASGSTPMTSRPKEKVAGFKLDPARIAALHQDTAKVSALLAGIFIDDSAPVAVATETDIEEEKPAEGIMGLDESHTALCRMLLSRTQWTRNELIDLAADLDLMVDGALERINEAAFDRYDMAFTEGDEPIEVNSEIREKVEA